MTTHRDSATGRRTPEPKASGLPWVAVNMAMTADGKIATANRAVTSFGSRRDHERLLALRATADAVLCGANTAQEEGITLGPGPLRFRQRRLKRGLAEFNLRIVVSGSAALDPESDLFRHRFSPIIVLTTERAARSRVRCLGEKADAVCAFGRTQLDLAAALRWLRREWGVRRLICEGGGALNDAMFRARLVHEVHLTVCPVVFGGRSSPTIADGEGFGRLTHAAQLTLKSRRLEGEEMFLVYSVDDPSSSSSRAISHKASERRLK